MPAGKPREGQPGEGRRAAAVGRIGGATDGEVDDQVLAWPVGEELVRRRDPLGALVAGGCIADAGHRPRPGRWPVGAELAHLRNPVVEALPVVVGTVEADAQLDPGRPEAALDQELGAAGGAAELRRRLR